MRLKASICCTLTIALLALGAPAWAAKVKVCHVPPGNPANFHTITVDDNAVQAHLAHGDLLGSCAAHCDQLCDDGNACTIDACDANEHCLLNHPPVNCDDSNLCTIDTCDPASGCHSTPKVCQDTDLCTVNTCDPMTGNCAFPPVACPAGQACNASNGNCETAAAACPCVDQLAGWSAAVNGPILSCLVSSASDGPASVILFISGNLLLRGPHPIQAECADSRSVRRLKSRRSKARRASLSSCRGRPRPV